MPEGYTDDGGLPRELQQDPNYGTIMNWNVEPKCNLRRSELDTRVFTDPDPENSIMPDDNGCYPQWVSDLYPNMGDAWGNPDWVPLQGLFHEKVAKKVDIDSKPEFDRLLHDLTAGLDHDVEEAKRQTKKARVTVSGSITERRYSFQPLFDHEDGSRTPVKKPKNNAKSSSRTGSKHSDSSVTKNRKSDAAEKGHAPSSGPSPPPGLHTEMKRQSLSSNAVPISVPSEQSSRRSSEIRRRSEDHRRKLSPVRESEHSNPGSATKPHGRKTGHAHQIVYSPLKSNRSKAKLDVKIKPPSLFSSRAKILAFRDAHAAATQRNYKEAYKSGDELADLAHDQDTAKSRDSAFSKAAYSASSRRGARTDSDHEDEDSEREAVRMFVRNRRASKKLAKEREREAARQAEEERNARQCHSRDRSREHSSRHDERHHRHEHRRGAHHSLDGHRSTENYSDAEASARHTRATQRRGTMPSTFIEQTPNPLDSVYSWQRPQRTRDGEQSTHDQHKHRRHNSMPAGERDRTLREGEPASARSTHRRTRSGAREQHEDVSSNTANVGRMREGRNGPLAPQSWPFVYGQPAREDDRPGSRRRAKGSGLSTLLEADEDEMLNKEQIHRSERRHSKARRSKTRRFDR